MCHKIKGLILGKFDLDRGDSKDSGTCLQRVSLWKGWVSISHISYIYVHVIEEFYCVLLNFVSDLQVPQSPIQ